MKSVKTWMEKREETVGGLLGLFLVVSVFVGVFGFCIYDYFTPFNYNQEPAKAFYETPHKLSKMFARENEITIRQPAEGKLSGSFFLGIGNVSGTYREGTETKSLITQVRFAWESHDNIYTTATLPLDKVKIKLVENNQIPTVSFFLNSSKIGNSRHPSCIEKFSDECERHFTDNEIRTILENYDNPDEALSKYLDYVIFTVKPEDWPTNINLPLNQGYGQ